MERFVFLLVVLAGSLTTLFGSELRPISISGRQQGQGHQYTVTYTSSEPAVVLWGAFNRRFYTKEDSEVSFDSRFSDGEGESTLTQTTPEEGAVVALILSDTSSYYIFKKFVGNKELPEVDIEIIGGKVVEYTPHVPFEVRLRYNNIPSGYSVYRDMPLWFFNYVDQERLSPILQTASTFDQSYSRYMSAPQSVERQGYTEVSTTLEFESQEGMVIVMFQYSNQDIEVARGTTFAIKQANSIGPFPTDFLGVSTSMTGESQVYCTDGYCTFLCDGFGGDVEKVEVRRESDGALIEPLYTMKKEWAVISEYQLYPVTDYTQRLVCTATNKRNEIAEKQITLFTNDL